MKAFFFDIDGTLIDSFGGVRTISPNVIEQLERLHAVGHKLVICSGRPYAMIGEDLRLPLFDAYVMSNGAHVEADGRTLFTNVMDAALARNFAELFEDLGMEYMLQTAHHIYLRRDFCLIQRFFAEFAQPSIFTFDFDRDEVLERTIKLEAHATELDHARVREAVEGRAGYTAHMDGNGSYNAFEIYSPTISKAVGIGLVLEHYGIAVENSYGFGDGINDLEMIQAVGTGVAMGNACSELKQAADVICGTVKEDGLARYLAMVE
ncbi:MAG: HAD family hydrolase [Atopobiaceae bacterium]|nr:HAD family hydrolase [Atopobiaceae bacterium]